MNPRGDVCVENIAPRFIRRKFCLLLCCLLLFCFQFRPLKFSRFGNEWADLIRKATATILCLVGNKTAGSKKKNRKQHFSESIPEIWKWPTA